MDKLKCRFVACFSVWYRLSGEPWREQGGVRDAINTQRGPSSGSRESVQLPDDDPRSAGGSPPPPVILVSRFVRAKSGVRLRFGKVLSNHSRCPTPLGVTCERRVVGGGAGQDGGGGRRLLHFISSKPFQYL